MTTMSRAAGNLQGLAAFAVCLVTAMTVLDTTIANVSLATIAGNLGASQSQSTWVITFYSVANAIVIPITGWLSAVFGAQRLFLFCTAAFVAASLFCGMSNSLGMLIVCRILQGAAAGPLMQLSQSLLIAIFPESRRTLALSLWSMTMVEAPVLGPILGGFICETWSWHWVFFVNVPVGGLAVVILWLILSSAAKPEKAPPIDTIGLVLVILGIGALQLMLDEGKDEDWFASTYICVLAGISLLSLTALVLRELSVESPVVDLKLFAHKNFAVGTLCLCVGYGVYFAAMLLLPMLLQQQLGYTASWAGLTLAPVGIIPILSTPILGKFSSKLNLRLMACLAFVGLSAACLLRAGITPSVDYETLAWQQFWQGFAVVFFLMPVTAVLLTGLTDAQDVANATSLSTSLRVLSGSIASSLTTTFWSRREALHHERLTEAINPFNEPFLQAYDAATESGLEPLAFAAQVQSEITRQGYILSFVELFQCFALVCFVFALVIWLADSPGRLTAKSA